MESFEQVDLLDYGTHRLVAAGPMVISNSGLVGIVTAGPTQGQHATNGMRYLAFNARASVHLHGADHGAFPRFHRCWRSAAQFWADSHDDHIRRGFRFRHATVADFDPPSGNVIFFGFTSDVPLTEVTFHTTIGDNIAIDSMRYASVPEPSVALLGLCGVGWMTSRRRGTPIAP